MRVLNKISHIGNCWLYRNTNSIQLNISSNISKPFYRGDLFTPIDPKKAPNQLQIHPFFCKFDPQVLFKIQYDLSKPYQNTGFKYRAKSTSFTSLSGSLIFYFHSSYLFFISTYRSNYVRHSWLYR